MGIAGQVLCPVRVTISAHRDLTVHHGGTGLVRDDEAASDSQQVCACLLFNVSPDFIRAQHQRCILCAFPDCLTCHARIAVRRTQCMRRRELVDPQHTHTAPGQLVQRSTPHGTQAEDDGIVDGGHGGSFLGVSASWI